MSDLSTDALRQIRAVHEAWLACELAGDGPGLLQWCTADVVWLPPGAPALRGQPAVARWLAVQAEAAVAVEHLAITRLDVQGTARLAYKVADFVARFRPPAGSGVQMVRGTHVWVLREVAPADWRVAVVTWSLAGTPEPAA